MRAFGLAIIIFLLVALPAVEQAKEDGMVKAMWVTRFSITSPERCARVVEIAKNHGYTDLFVQVRGRGDAFYKSHLEPRAQELAGQPEYFDPLQTMIDLGKQSGIHIHAWLNVHYTWGLATKPVSPEHIVNKHPGWLMKNRQGEVPMTANGEVEGAYTCPSNPEVKEHIVDCFLDVAENYDVAGVHLDFVRYPNREYCYCDTCLAGFREYLSTRVPKEDLLVIENSDDRTALTLAYSKEWDDWRRDQISDLVEKVHARVKALRPELIVSAAVFANRSDAYDNRFQDWKLWLDRDYLDLLCPMAYSTDTAAVAAQIKDAVSLSDNTPVWAGIGAWRITPEETAAKIKASRDLGARGFILFSYSGVTDEGAREEYLRTLDQP